jgi:hypothetical protein
LSFRKLCLIIPQIAAILLAGCGGQSQGTIQVNLQSIQISPSNPSVAAGLPQQFKATGKYTDGSSKDLSASATWSSSNQAAANISSAGLASTKAQGSSTVSTAFGSVTGKTTLTVTSPAIVSISVTPSGRTIAPGTKQNFSATGSFNDSTSQVITSDVSWASDNTAVATVSGNGAATAVASGIANISATMNSVTGSAPLNVSPATLSSIAVTPATAVLAPASTLNYAAIGTYSDGSTQNISNVVAWSSADTNVATIGASGTATGQSAGSVTITAQLGAVSSTAGLVVESSALKLITITPATATIPSQIATQFSATGTFQDNSVQNLTNAATWTSAPASVATVSDANSKGLATGVSPGSATLTAVFAGIVGTASIHVTSATLNSITISPGSASISLGNSQQFSATGNFSDGTTVNLTNQVAWSSSNANVAVIGSNGSAISAGAGTTTITAALNGVHASAVLTVH